MTLQSKSQIQGDFHVSQSEETQIYSHFQFSFYSTAKGLQGGEIIGFINFYWKKVVKEIQLLSEDVHDPVC